MNLNVLYLEHKRYNNKIMEYKEQMWRFAYAWTILNFIGIIEWCMNPVIYDIYTDIYGDEKINNSFSRHLPYAGIFPWKIDTMPKYMGTFMFQLLGTLASGIGHAYFEIVFVTLLTGACVHLNYLSDCLSDNVNNSLILK